MPAISRLGLLATALLHLVSSSKINHLERRYPMLYSTIARAVALGQTLLQDKAAVFALHMLLSMVFVYVLISLIEYLAHRYLQHSKSLSKTFPRLKLLDKIFTDHAKVHHHDAYDIFNYEPDLRLRMYNLIIKCRTSCAVIVVVGGPLYLFDHLTAITFLVGLVLHNLVWSAVHIEMHVNAGALIRKAPFFPYWERHHFLHHLYPGKNYNALFPLWDWLLGTDVGASKLDLEALDATRRQEAVSRRAFLRAKLAGGQLTPGLDEHN